MTSRRFGLLAPLLVCPLGCALNLSEARPARVLRGGEMQVSQVSNVVIPTTLIGRLIGPARRAAEAKNDGESLSEAEEADLVAGGAAVAVQAPGYSTHLEFGMGLGYRWDLAARMGNGIYGLSARRGFELEAWDLSLGSRVAYNSGGSWIPYADELNTFFHVGNMRRVDSQLFAQFGREWGDWFRLWFGAKAMLSAYSMNIDTRALGVSVHDDVKDHIWYGGTFVGGALGFRYAFFVWELMLMQSWGDAQVAGIDVDVGGLLVVPAFGFRVNF